MTIPEITPLQMLGFALLASSILFFFLLHLVHKHVSLLYGELAVMQSKINDLVLDSQKLRFMCGEESNAVWKQIRSLNEIVKELRQHLVTRR